MPRPRTPTNVLAISGGLAHDKKRYANRTAEPKPTGGLGYAPKHFDKEHKAIWNELVRAIPPDVLTNADRIILELATRLTFQMRHGEFNAAAASQLRGCLGSLAMTPADRSKVQIVPGKDGSNKAIAPSPFARFLSPAS